MITLKLRVIKCLIIALVALLIIPKNTDAKGGGRGGGRGGFRSRGAIHRGGGGGSYSDMSSDSATNSTSNRPISEPIPSPYGNTFKDDGPPENSYLFNNYYRDLDSDAFLIGSLFYGTGQQKTDPVEAKKYYEYIGFEEFYRRWDDEKDKEWRATTRAPYFENKIPGENKNFPASAVVGAATAFGLVSLLPLNVPPGMPLIYCGSTDIMQSLIRINNKDTYVCKNSTIFQFSCGTDLNNECTLEKVQCDLNDGINRKIYCLYGTTLLSTTPIFCNSTTPLNGNNSNKQSIVKCYEGQLPKSRTSFIPTTESSSLSTPKPLSLSANVHILLLKMMEKWESTMPESYPYSDSNAWRPEALTFPPEMTTEKPRPTTTKRPFVWMEKVYINDSGTEKEIYRPIPKNVEGEPFYIPSNWYKVYTTSTEPIVETTTKPSTATEIPYVWMRKVSATGDHIDNKTVPVTKSEVELAAMFNYFPKSWFKVPVIKNIEEDSPNP